MHVNEIGEMYVGTMANVSNILLNPSLPTMPNSGIRYPLIYCVATTVVILAKCVFCLSSLLCFRWTLTLHVL